jgi:hypothetical protein
MQIYEERPSHARTSAGQSWTAFRQTSGPSGQPEGIVPSREWMQKMSGANALPKQESKSDPRCSRAARRPPCHFSARQTLQDYATASFGSRPIAEH